MTEPSRADDFMTLFADLAALSDALAVEGGRLKKRATIAVEVARIAGESLADAGLFCLYLAGQPFPEADPRKLNAGGALLTRVLKDVSGCTDAMLAAAYRRHGDLGAAAFDLMAGVHAQVPTLTLGEVAAAFDAMATARTTAARTAQVDTLLRRATAPDAKYLLKLMLGDMRIGVKQSLVEEAIAVAADADVQAVRHAVMLEANLSLAVERAFAGTLAEARMRLFHPLGFMLASPVETPEEAVARFSEKPAKAQKPKKRPSKREKKKAETNEESADMDFTDLGDVQGIVPEDAAEAGLAEDVDAVAKAAPRVIQAFLEDKYDGMRAQIHCGEQGSEHSVQPHATQQHSTQRRVAIYSRNREDITQSFPEIEEAFRGVTEPLILDGELLGWELVEGRALPFSVLGQRIGRKRVDNEMRRQIPAVFMAFDLLFEGGELLLPLPLRERRAKLEGVVARLSAETMSAIERDEHAEAAQGGLFAAFETAKEPRVQRLMLSPAKLVESAEEIDQAYAAARARANEGVMLKAAGSAYLPGRRGLSWVKLKRELATLDVVISGAEFGHGRRAGLLSDYTFAVQGEGGKLLNVGKAYSGVTDAEIAELTAWLTAHTLEDYGHFRTVEPLRVIEVAFNNIMRSERHESGFALRFPRILRIRDDKPLDEIDTLERVEEIYQSQPDKGGD